MDRSRDFGDDDRALLRVAGAPGRELVEEDWELCSKGALRPACKVWAEVTTYRRCKG